MKMFYCVSPSRLPGHKHKVQSNGILQSPLPLGFLHGKDGAGWSRWGMARRRGCCPCAPYKSVPSVPDASKEAIEQGS